MQLLSLKKNRSFYILLMSIMMPIVVQNFISSSLNLVDNVMVGQLGETYITSVGLGNQIFFLMTLILFGANSGTSIFVAQYYGKNEHSKIKGVLSIALWFGLFISSLFFIVGFIFPEQTLGLMSKDANVVQIGADYLRIVSLSYWITAVNFSFGFSARSIGKPQLPMKASIISLGVNTALNYILIFGHLGFEPMGVKGAAIATLIARIIELFILIYSVYTKIPEIAVYPSHLFNISKAQFKLVMQKALPVIVNETFWALGMTTYALVYARIGTEAAASVMIANTVNSLFMVLSFGLGNASAVMLGNTLGAGEISKAIDYNKKFLALALMGGAVVGVLIAMLAPLIVKLLYQLTPESYTMTLMTLFIMAAFMPFKFYNTIVIIGTLRSGGDTLFSMLLEIGCVWLIGVPLALLGGFVLGQPVFVVVAMVHIEEVVKMILGFPRVKSNKWANNIVSDH